jgi:hypothetical protein
MDFVVKVLLYFTVYLGINQNVPMAYRLFSFEFLQSPQSLNTAVSTLPHSLLPVLLQEFAP